MDEMLNTSLCPTKENENDENHRRSQLYLGSAKEIQGTTQEASKYGLRMTNPPPKKRTDLCCP